jgi:uncharacterized protein (DUF1499 family)
LKKQHSGPIRYATALVALGSGVVTASIVVALVSGPGYQAGLWEFGTGFTILRWSAYVAAGGAVVALAGCVLAGAQRRLLASSIGLAAALLALALIGPSWDLEKTAKQVPHIHDITTDTINPPQFVALLRVRRTTPNGPEYDGEAVAREQRAAYPDIQPVILDEPPARGFERALKAARTMGWNIVDAAQSDGRIEATATTRWFRFKDDIVIRIVAQGSGSRVDVRSKSRLGRSDLGANAKRIRAYVQTLART